MKVVSVLISFVFILSVVCPPCYGHILTWVYETYERGMKQMEKEGRLLPLQSLTEASPDVCILTPACDTPVVISISGEL